jgi:hypothetical protein
VVDRDTFCTKHANERDGAKAAPFKQLSAEFVPRARLSVAESLGSVRAGTESGRAQTPGC